VSTSLRASQPWRRRCNAHCKQRPLRYCRNWAVRGKTRCKFHGGMSTGPKTPEGKARVVAAMVAGRRRWVERMKAEGRPFPWAGKRHRRRVEPSAQPAPSSLDALARQAGVRLPKQYRHMTFDEFFAAGKEALRQMQERLKRTGRLIG